MPEMAYNRQKSIRISIRGIVQGVGFRPFIHNLAKRCSLNGTVANTGTGVDILVTGKETLVEEFLSHLKASPPPLAHITEIEISTWNPCEKYQNFTISPTIPGTSRITLVSPDIACCTECLSDIMTPENRRHDYPFTNCTNCGPRLSIIEKIPYDRTNTSMAEFSMCNRCRFEYENPSDRRFHAQPNACPECGPELSWHDSNGNVIGRGNAECMDACALALAQGNIVAIKGLGGFHLAVDAGSKQAIARLRNRKSRKHKPLAIMVPDLRTAESVAFMDKYEQELLLSQERPIVLLEKRSDRLADALSPGIREIGIMLAYTPFHHLLFRRNSCPEVLVMTSGNPAGEPLCIQNSEALARLRGIADYFLLHNRRIVTRVDDSVVRIRGGRLQTIRRSRGYVPLPLHVQGVSGSVLACGAELKNTFSISRDGQVFTSQHVGDLKSPATLSFFEESVQYFKSLLVIRPEVAVCDLHPDYLSSRYAESSGLPPVRVQHHHAHAAAVMAEHQIEEAIAVILDGTGLGTDGTVWGGEFFHIDRQRCTRLGYLLPIPMPGGDAAAAGIWRMGLSLLSASGIDIMDDTWLTPAVAAISAQERSVIQAMIKKGINTPMASSTGRLFDAVASLLGVRQEVTYEAQGAIELESLAWKAVDSELQANNSKKWHPSVQEKDGIMVIDTTCLAPWILDDMRKGVPGSETALHFHMWLARSGVEVIKILAERRAVRRVILGGGCFQNRLLLDIFTKELEKCGFSVYTGETIPVNDAGISVGQVFVAGCRAGAEQLSDTIMPGIIQSNHQ